jgi:hypothetical protein
MLNLLLISITWVFSFSVFNYFLIGNNHHGLFACFEVELLVQQGKCKWYTTGGQGI